MSKTWFFLFENSLIKIWFEWPLVTVTKYFCFQHDQAGTGQCHSKQGGKLQCIVQSAEAISRHGHFNLKLLIS